MRKVLQGIVGSGVGDPSRRNFLKGAAALGASALLPSSELPALGAEVTADSQTEQGLLKPIGDGPLGDDATVDKDVMVRMGDGVRIACDVYRPKAPGRYPVLYASSPYIKDAVWVPMDMPPVSGELAAAIKTLDVSLPASEVTKGALKAVNPGTKFVPGHGPLADGAALMRYRDMLVTVRDRVQKLKTAGRSEPETVAAKPTADLDATWGQGFIQPEVFVSMVYKTL